MVEAESNISNSYEEARKQRLEENKKRFEDLGILSISKGLTEITNAEKKSHTQQIRSPKPKSIPSDSYALEPRRSSRARNPVPSYRDELDIGLPPPRRGRKASSSWESYLARPADECKMASYEERAYAMKAAEKIQSNLQSENPSFVKSMVRSHVYSCFWLGLPSQFCKEHLPKKELNVVLEDENGTEYEAMYLGKRAGLSGGWRGFALDHKLDDGDAVVFEMVEPTRFKVYIVRASSPTSPKQDNDILDNKAVGSKKTSKRTRAQDSKLDRKKKSSEPIVSESDDLSSPKKLQPEQDDHEVQSQDEKDDHEVQSQEEDNEEERPKKKRGVQKKRATAKPSTSKNGHLESQSQEEERPTTKRGVQKKTATPNPSTSETSEIAEKNVRPGRKPRKERLYRKRAR